jgi:hypothetical protein
MIVIYFAPTDFFGAAERELEPKSFHTPPGYEIMDTSRSSDLNELRRELKA